MTERRRYQEARAKGLSGRKGSSVVRAEDTGRSVCAWGGQGLHSPPQLSTARFVNTT